MNIYVIKLVLLLIIFPIATSFAEDDYQVKSLRVYQTGDQISFPVSLLGSKLTIEFDIKGDNTPNWEILFLFCDKNWEPYENGLLINDNSNIERNLWFETLPNYSDRADYHYSGNFPNENVAFPFSGKWMFFIQDSYDSDIIYGEGKFYVVNDVATTLNTILEEKSVQGVDIVPAVFGEVLNMKTSVTIPESLFVNKVSHIEMVENKKIEDAIIVGKTYDNEFRYYEIDGYNSYSFFAKNIQPGGAYRQVDLMNRTKYTAPKTYAHFDGIEVSNKFNPKGNDYFGGSKLMDYSKPYSEYLDVEFRLRLPDNYYENIFLVGAFTNWDIYPDYRMIEKDGVFSTVVELKRGIYDYQYIVADMRNDYIKNIDWIELEGNSWNTKREFYIFLFYNSDEDGGYDKIIAFDRIRSGN